MEPEDFVTHARCWPRLAPRYYARRDMYLAARPGCARGETVAGERDATSPRLAAKT
jgi:hypothetical protein